MNNLSEQWKAIDLKFYLKFVEYNFSLDKEMSDVDRELLLLAFCENTNVKHLRSIPRPDLDLIRERWDFLSENFSLIEGSPFINLGEDMYVLDKDFNRMSFDKWENIDAVLKASEDGNYLKNIHMLLAITMQPNASYDYYKAVEYSEQLLNQPMYHLIPNISFFLFSEQPSLNNILSYLKVQEEQQITRLEAMLNSPLNSIPCLVGFRPLKNLLMRILRKLIRYWLKRYKRYSVGSTIL